MDLEEIRRQKHTYHTRFYSSAGNLFPPVDVEIGVYDIYTEDYVVRAGPLAGYRKLIAWGVDATTGLSGSKVTLEAHGGSAQIVSHRHYMPEEPPDPTYPRILRYSGQLIPPSLAPAPSLSISQADNQALMKFIQRARSAQTEIQAIVIAGEFGKTLKTLTSAARSLRKGVLKHLVGLEKDKRGFKKASNRSKRKHLSEKWLELQYGIRPLISDIRNASEYLARRSTGRPALRRVGADASETAEDVNLGTSGVSVGGYTKYYDTMVTEKSEVRYYGAVRLATSEGGSAIETAGLSFKDFIPSIWELVPYSFLVDYFTNVGDIISAATFASSNFAWKAKGWKSTVSLETKNFRQEPTTDPPGSLAYDNVSISPGSVRSTRTVINRGPHQGQLIPTLEFSLPGSTTKWINVGALLSVHSRIIPF